MLGARVYQRDMLWGMTEYKTCSLVGKFVCSYNECNTFSWC